MRRGLGRACMASILTPGSAWVWGQKRGSTGPRRALLQPEHVIDGQRLPLLPEHPQPPAVRHDLGMQLSRHGSMLGELRLELCREGP
jgi:hypothetical protein